MTELTLTAVFEVAEEGGYIGYVAELPGANTQGETLEEMREKPRRGYRTDPRRKSGTVLKRT